MTAQEKWTYPGNVDDESGFPCVVDQDGCVVAAVWDDGLTEDESDEVMERRAHLIAASPALYEALEALAGHADAMEAQNQDYHGLPDGTPGPIRSQILTEALAALSLARGES